MNGFLDEALEFFEVFDEGDCDTALCSECYDPLEDTAHYPELYEMGLCVDCATDMGYM